MDAFTFGDRIKELRLKRNLSQEDVAKRLGLTKATISGYEKNSKTPSVETVINLAVYFNVSTDYLLGLDKRNIIRIKDLSLGEQKEFLRIFNAIEDFIKK